MQQRCQFFKIYLQLKKQMWAIWLIRNEWQARNSVAAAVFNKPARWLIFTHQGV